jgi:hypothetical protein
VSRAKYPLAPVSATAKAAITVQRNTFVHILPTDDANRTSNQIPATAAPIRSTAGTGPINSGQSSGLKMP